MSAYIIRRFIQAVIIVIFVTIMVFLVVRLLPGDPILMYMSQDQVGSLSKEQIEITRHEFGLDKPLYLQYGDWVVSLFRLELGRSVGFRMDVSHLIATRAPVTIYLGILALIIGNSIGIFLGVISAIRRGRALDLFVTIIANVGITIPIFWLGIILIYVFGLKLGWLPLHSFTSPFDDFWLSIRQIIMPVICLSIFSIGAVARQTRSSILEVVRQDYIRTAWSKGLRERNVVFSHVLKNGLIPIVTLCGMQVPMILGGQVLIETVFNISGMGRLAVTAVQSLDYAVVQSIILLIAIMVVTANFVVDVAYGWLDPRIRYA